MHPLSPHFPFEDISTLIVQCASILMAHFFLRGSLSRSNFPRSTVPVFIVLGSGEPRCFSHGASLGVGHRSGG